MTARTEGSKIGTASRGQLRAKNGLQPLKHILWVFILVIFKIEVQDNFLNILQYRAVMPKCSVLLQRN